MHRRSPARFLAPLALLGVVLALFLVIKAADIGGSSSSSSTTTSTAASRPETSTTRTPPRRRSTRPAIYRVKPGDTLQAIAASTGVNIDVLRQLNPAINPAALVVGQIIKIRG